MLSARLAEILLSHALRAHLQARRFGAEILTAQEAVEIRREDPYRKVILSDGSELTGYAVLIAPGMEVRRLEADGIEPLLGTGVYYGAGHERGRDLPRPGRRCAGGSSARAGLRRRAESGMGEPGGQRTRRGERQRAGDRNGARRGEQGRGAGDR